MLGDRRGGEQGKEKDGSSGLASASRIKVGWLKKKHTRKVSCAAFEQKIESWSLSSQSKEEDTTGAPKKKENAQVRTHQAILSLGLGNKGNGPFVRAMHLNRNVYPSIRSGAF